MCEVARPLFEWTMDELRNSFVRARFDQQDVFGTVNIEAWLDLQRKLDAPAIHDPEWSKLSRVIRINLSRTMQGLGNPQRLASSFNHFPDRKNNPLRQSSRDKTEFREIQPIMQALHASPSLKLYYGLKDVLVIDTTGGRNRCWQIHLHEPGQIKFDHDLIACWNSIIDVIIAEWLYRRRRWKTARKAICNRYEKVIAHVREKAERDFNSAVAVSDDGKKILHADEVVVLTTDGTLFSFEASAFRNNKILRAKNFRRVAREDDGIADYHAFDGKEEEYLEALGLHVRHNCWIETLGDEQIFISYSLNTQNETRFLTHEKFCPSPLPEGGRKF